MQVQGYGVVAEWDGQVLTARGTTKLAHFALAGPGVSEDVTIPGPEIAAVELSPASLITNGELVITTTDGAKYQLHFRRKQSASFVSLAEQLPRTSVPSLAPQTRAPRSVRPQRVSDSADPPTIEQLVETLRPLGHALPLDEQIEVAGETYHAKGVKKLFRHHERPITSAGVTLEDVDCYLIPQHWNEHDPNAVAVVVTSWHVGYLPAELASNYSARLNRVALTGHMVEGRARVWAKSDSGVVRARVTVLIPEADLV